ncbi:MAG: hypothetical protein WC604_03715 [Candidatus Gracilibacteria bacterium]
MTKKAKLFAIVVAVLAIFGCAAEPDGKEGTPSDEGAVEAGINDPKIIVVTPESACIEQGEKQQFTSSVDGVTWRVESLLQDNLFIGTIDEDGVFTAYDKPALGTVIASKGGVHGYAYVTVVPAKAFCTAKKVVYPKEKTEEEEKKSDDGTTTPPPPPPKKEEPYQASGGKWAAAFDVKLKYEVIGDEFAGYVTHQMEGGFHFTVVDYATGELKIIEPMGFINATVSDDVATCEVVAMNDPFLWITTTDGKVVDTDVVFGKDYIVVDHGEGVKMTCLNAGFSDPNASVVSLVGQHVSPITVKLEDGAKAPIQGSFSFAGRQATIDGTVTIRRVD